MVAIRPNSGDNFVHFIVVGCVVAVIACLLYAIMRAKKS
jgi:hypothetical protein